MKKKFLAIITVDNEELLVSTQIENGEDENEIDIKSAVSSECGWVNQSGLVVDVVREVTDSEIEKLY